jgi:hypothetical protein
MAHVHSKGRKKKTKKVCPVNVQFRPLMSSERFDAEQAQAQILKLQETTNVSLNARDFSVQE